MDADFLLCSGYKFYGPHVGVLYSKPGALERLPTDRLSVQDPAAPYRIETGTLNHAAIDGLRAAVEYLAGWGTGATLRERIVDAMTGICAYEHRLAGAIMRACGACPGVRVWGPGFRRARARADRLDHARQAHGGRGGERSGRAGNLCLGRKFLRRARRRSAGTCRARRLAAHRHLDVHQRRATFAAC